MTEEILLLSSHHTLIGKGREVDIDLNMCPMKQYKFFALFDGVFYMTKLIANL